MNWMILGKPHSRKPPINNEDKYEDNYNYNFITVNMSKTISIQYNYTIQNHCSTLQYVALHYITAHYITLQSMSSLQTTLHECTSLCLTVH